jgi:hypothetical protein
MPLFKKLGQKTQLNRLVNDHICGVFPHEGTADWSYSAHGVQATRISFEIIISFHLFFITFRSCYGSKSSLLLQASELAAASEIIKRTIVREEPLVVRGGGLNRHFLRQRRPRRKIILLALFFREGPVFAVGQKTRNKSPSLKIASHTRFTGS